MKDASSKVHSFVRAYVLRHKGESDLPSMLGFMKRVYTATSKVYAEASKSPKSPRSMVMSIPQESPAEKKWREICLLLIERGVKSWQEVEEIVRKEYDAMHTNPVEDLMAEGHLRLQVLRHMTIPELLKYLLPLDTEKRIDLFMVLNDPTSKANQSICDLVRGTLESQRVLLQVLNFMTKGRKLGYIFDINSFDKKGRNLFMEAVKAGREQIVKFILENFPEVDLYRKYNGSTPDTVHTPLSYALMKSFEHVTQFPGRIERINYWRIVQHLLDRAPKGLQSFYIDGKKGVYGKEKGVLINNIYLVEHYPITDLIYLIREKRMEPNVSGNSNETIIQGLRRVLRQLEDDAPSVSIDEDHIYAVQAIVDQIHDWEEILAGNIEEVASSYGV